MKKLVIALTLAAATALPIVLQSTSADAGYMCRIAGTLADARTALPVLALMAARTGIASLSIAGQPGAGDIAAKGETGRKPGLRCWTNRTDEQPQHVEQLR